MTGPRHELDRRAFLVSASLALAAPARVGDAPAQVAITLDLEMSRHYPRWEDTHWDYEKGNLDQPTKEYAVEAARRVRAQGGRVHFFCVGRVLEQADAGWLEGLVQDGHPIGNHTYDHVNIHATRPEDLQFRFQRSPWLIEGKSPTQVVVENVRLATRAMEVRLKSKPVGFRTPGGSHAGLRDRPDLQRLLLDQGFSWVSSLYPAHATGPPDEAVFASIVAAQAQAQPFAYPTGLVEVPMSPISDVTAMRAARWPLPDFLEATRRAVTWTIERGAVFDFLAHPSCLVVTDPEFRAIDLILKLVKEAGDKAGLADLDAIARLIATGRGGPPR